MSPRANPEGQFLRDALLLLNGAISTIDQAQDLLDGQDVEIRARWSDMPEARRLREMAAEIVRKAEGISRSVF